MENLTSANDACRAKLAGQRIVDAQSPESLDLALEFATPDSLARVAAAAPETLGDFGNEKKRRAQALVIADVPPGEKLRHVSPDDFFDVRVGLEHEALLKEVVKLGPIARGPGRTLWHYEKGVWLPEGDDEVTRRVERLLRGRFRVTHARQIREALTARPQYIGIESPDPSFINCANGVLDLGQLKLLDHDAEYRSTYQLAVGWDPAATCPSVDLWMAQVFEEDVVPLIWEIIGVSILATMPYHRAVLLYGSGRNGKGSLIRLIERLIGRAHVAAIPLQALSEDRFAAAGLFGKVANLAGDLDARHVRQTDVFKTATGGDLVFAQKKYGQPFQFYNTATMIFSANELPGTGDYSDGFFDRWIVVPFMRQFRGKEDPSWEQRMHGEMPGVLVKAVDGAQRAERHGGFTLPQSVVQATSQYRTEADPVRSFCDDLLIIEPEAREKRKDVYDRFKEWTVANGHRTTSARTFYQRLRQIDGIQDVKHRSNGEDYIVGARLPKVADRLY